MPADGRGRCLLENKFLVHAYACLPADHEGLHLFLLSFLATQNPCAKLVFWQDFCGISAELLFRHMAEG